MRYNDERPANEPDEAADAEPIQTQTAPNETTLPPLTTAPVAAEVPSNPHKITAPLIGEDFDFAPPSEDIQLRIQKQLKDRGEYQGKQNGKWGNLSVYGIGSAVGHPVSTPDRELCVRIQEFANELDGKSVAEGALGYLDEDTWIAFARGLETARK